MNLKKQRLILFWVFFKIGAFTFGGGFAMIPLIEREVVEKNKWISQKEICDILAISQSFPGAIAINSATIVGYRVAGYLGAICATFGVVIPSFIIITLIASILTYVMDISVVQSAFKAISSSVVALLIVAAIRVGKSAIKGTISLLIAITSLVLLLWLGINPIYAILFGIISGLIIYVIEILKRKSN